MVYIIVWNNESEYRIHIVMVLDSLKVGSRDIDLNNGDAKRTS